MLHIGLSKNNYTKKIYLRKKNYIKIQPNISLTDTIILFMKTKKNTGYSISKNMWPVSGIRFKNRIPDPDYPLCENRKISDFKNWIPNNPGQIFRIGFFSQPYSFSLLYCFMHNEAHKTRVLLFFATPFHFFATPLQNYLIAPGFKRITKMPLELKNN